MILNKIVLRVGDPEASRGLVSIKQAPRSLDSHDQIPCDVIVSLDGIFKEDCVTHDVLPNIIFYSQVLDTMEGDSSIVSLMD